MIRFVDLRGQDTGNRFMFWDTVTDSPIYYFGVFAFNTLDEVKEAWPSLGYLERIVSLCPDWTKESFDPKSENWTVDDGAPCVLCRLHTCGDGPDHVGPCRSRNELMTELVVLP